jgi:agmatinase
MDFPHYFADAESTFDQARFVLFGVPFEKTSSFRHGADKGPFEICQASWNFERYDLRTNTSFDDIAVHDYGDLDVKALTSKQVFESTKDFTASLLKQQKVPVALGGDHSITPGIVTAFPKDIAVLSLDAHLDFRERYKNDPYNHACVIKRIADHVNIKNIALLGVRSVEKEEYEQSKKLGLFFIDAFTIRSQGLVGIIEKTKEYLKGKPLYLTIDIDVIDPAYAPGTSTPEPFGLTPEDILGIIDAFSPSLLGFDLVEVCPPYDHGQTAVLAAKLVRSCISGIWYSQKEVT